MLSKDGVSRWLVEMAIFIGFGLFMVALGLLVPYAIAMLIFGSLVLGGFAVMIGWVIGFMIFVYSYGERMWIAWEKFWQF